MASTYNELGIELMATGENAGTWGTKTNTNLDIIQQAIAGYVAQAVTDGGTTALTITDGSTSTSVARNIVIKLTGALTGTSTVTVPDSVEKLYIVENATTGSQTVTFKTVSGTVTVDVPVNAPVNLITMCLATDVLVDPSVIVNAVVPPSVTA